MDLFFLIIEYVGIVAFAISGAMVAIDNEADFIGVIFLAIITSFAGGLCRDLILGHTPPRFFTSYTVHIIICVATAVIVFIFAAMFKKRYVMAEKRIDAINNIVDAAGIGVFSVAGTAIAIEAGFTSPFIPITLGMITSIGGGMCRDVILRQIPFVIKKRIYAVACLAGAGVYYFLFMHTEIGAMLATLIGAAVTFTLRILATVFKWNMPKAIDFSALSESDGCSIPEAEEQQSKVPENIL